MGICRQFDGNVANFISGDPFDVGTNKLTIAAWVKSASAVVINRGITGKIALGDVGGWRLILYTGTPVLTFSTQNDVGTQEDTNSAAITGSIFNVWRFFAVTYSLAGPAEIKFYSGNTASDIAQFGSTVVPTIGIGSTSSASCDIGRIATSSAPERYPFLGNIDQIGIWRVALSLAELKAFADCASALPQTSEAVYIYRITGASPEPNASTLTGTAGVINGTVPVITEITGCDLSALGHSKAEVKVPPISGGAGGGYSGCCGIGYGASGAYDPGSTGGDVSVQPGSQHEAPKYGDKPGLSKRHPWAYDDPKSLAALAERARRGK